MDEKTEKATTGKIRLTFSIPQARAYYVFLGSQIGTIQADLAIRDGRVSEISDQIATLQMQMDYIAEAIRKAR